MPAGAGLAGRDGVPWRLCVIGWFMRFPKVWRGDARGAPCIGRPGD
ncbi:hypothetical protein OCGS_0349 [Oceaniovalibus guishaninsula JLT2003]|uniref:Uncharacterized protein n=1 Tax=Oceaniovalibus guishaninsula JLT2003 TaxID=1231392 RepID=K2HR76_9RHOB|nr:hypothetical protein OCGS_0349 [Oceaniovalibus guishaninsula JLT2003]